MFNLFVTFHNVVLYKEKSAFVVSVSMYVEPSESALGWKYSRMDQAKFVEDSLKKFEAIWYA